MALFDDIPVVGEILGGGNWVTGLVIGVGAVVVLPLAAPILRPLAKTAIKGAFWPTRARPDWSKASVIWLPKLSPRLDRRPHLRRKRRHTIQGSHVSVGLERKLDPDRGNLGQRGLPGFLARAIGCKGATA